MKGSCNEFSLVNEYLFEEDVFDLALIPLKIPAGFAVCYNKFHDVEPKPSKDGDEYLENMGYFTEDILQIKRMKLKDGDWYVPSFNNPVIDLGWYPDGNILGHYGLVLVTVNEDYVRDILKEKVSTNRFEIRDTIEEWFQWLSKTGFYF